MPVTASDLPATKAELRRHFRAQRRAIQAGDRERFNRRICEHLVNGLALREHREIAAFLAFDGEPDLEPQLRAWHRQGLGIALPVVPLAGETDMTLRHWAPGGDMGHNVLGIREPGVGRDVALEELDVVLVPLVAFDASGNRLGMGAGYYDRFLATGPAAGPPLRVGVAYACQQAPGLPRDPWDIPLHAVVTEQGWLSCS